MPAKRFQIYLSPEQHIRIRSLSQSRNITMAELIRQAVDSFLNQTESTDIKSKDPLWSIIGITGEVAESDTAKDTK